MPPVDVRVTAPSFDPERGEPEPPDLDLLLHLFPTGRIDPMTFQGAIDEADVKVLERKGYGVERLGTGRRPAPARRPIPPTAMPARPSVRRVAVPGSVPPEAYRRQEPRPDDVWILQLDRPADESLRAKLAGAGADVVEVLPSNQCLVRMNIDARPHVQALPFVTSQSVYSLIDKVDPLVLAAREGPDLPPRVTYEVVVHRAEQRGDVTGWLEAKQIRILRARGTTISFAAAPGQPELFELAADPAVALIDEFVPPRAALDRARALVGVSDASHSPTDLVRQRGAGQIVAVADTGIDDEHPALRGRVVGVRTMGDNSSRDYDGHGTHVAGCVVATGKGAPEKNLRGIAPAAGLFFVAIGDRAGNFHGLETSAHYDQLLEMVYEAGARILNLSLEESGTLAAYKIVCAHIDRFVHEHPDLLVVVAAGNSADDERWPWGTVDLESVGAPATAQNVLAVGASCGDRPGGLDGVPEEETWNAFASFTYSHVPGFSSGDPSALAAFSGRGPCRGANRVKPDVVAPGTYIVSTKSRDAIIDPADPDPTFWGEFPSSKDYAYCGGTSMAAPIVSGCAARVREYLAEVIDDDDRPPSAALLKATLVNGTRWLTGEDALARHDRRPNYDQGFGCVDLSTTLPNNGAPALRLWFADGVELHESGTQIDFTFRVTSADPDLRVCLAWTDPPGRGVVNKLALAVAHRDGGGYSVGNADRPDADGPYDDANNVQVVRIEQPRLGDYVVQVDARALAEPPQQFALVVSGAVREFERQTSAGPRLIP